MYRYVAIAFILVHHTASASPLRFTIDCSDERGSYGTHFRSKLSDYSSRSRINTFCNLIQNAIPRAIEDGRFVPLDADLDQVGHSDTLMPTAVAPPNGFISKLGLPKLKVPRFRVPDTSVPKLAEYSDGLYNAPRVGSPVAISAILRDSGEASSAEKLEVIKKGVKKMLHFVKVLGQIDQYLSERTRIIVDKLSKTFSE